MPRPEVTPDELQRVAEHWQWVRAIACEHPEITFSGDGSVTCPSCGRPVQWLSDVQVENLRSTS